jgi:hypothetical protein
MQTTIASGCDTERAFHGPVDRSLQIGVVFRRPLRSNPDRDLRRPSPTRKGTGMLTRKGERTGICPPGLSKERPTRVAFAAIPGKA